MLDEDDLTPEMDDKNIDKMIGSFMKQEGMEYNPKSQISDLEEQLENEILTKLQNDIFKISEDIFYDLFSKVVGYDNKQILRYNREDTIPMWFCKNGMLTLKNTKCKVCGGEVIFEFQVILLIIIDNAICLLYL